LVTPWAIEAPATPAPADVPSASIDVQPPRIAAQQMDASTDDRLLRPRRLTWTPELQIADISGLRTSAQPYAV
jgi:hypothetical protein